MIGTRPHSPCYLLINALGLALCHKFSSLQRHLRSSISASLSIPASRRCTIHSSTACRFTFLLHTLLYTRVKNPFNFLWNSLLIVNNDDLDFFFFGGGGFNFSPTGPVALDFSLQLLWLCGGQASQGGGFSCGSWALGMWTSVQCSWRASLSPSVWNPPRPGVESVSPALTGRFLATGLPRDGPPPPFNRAIHSPSSTWSHRYSLPQDSCVFYQNFTFISLDSICSNIL